MRSSSVGMTKLATVACLATLATTTALPALAADLLVDPPVIEAPEVPVKSGGWYLRGDIGYGFRSMRDNPMYSVGGTGTELTFTSGEVEDSMELSLGIGYQVNDYLRVDATAGYVFENEFNGSTASGDPCAAGYTAGTTCVSTDSSSYTAFKLMANAYVDLGNFSGFTPYVGAGIGGWHVKYDDLTNAARCVNGAAACQPTDVGFTDVHDGASSWRFAWALHAGFSYSLTHALALDVGYSYNRVEGGAMFDWLDGSGTQGYDKGFSDHTIRAGLRYQLW